jgi:hypothetical protein
MRAQRRLAIVLVAVLAASCRSAAAPSGRQTGVWAAEPPGLSVLTDRSWTALTGDGWNRRESQDDRIVADQTAPLSQGSALEYIYPAGFAGGAAPATHFHALGGRKEIFVGLEFEVSNPWQGHASLVNKIQFLLTSNADVMMAMYGPPGGPYQLRVIPQWRENGDAWLVPNASDPPVTLGRWHRAEWYVKYESVPGAGDGIVRWWMDGALVGDYARVRFPDDNGFVEYQISPTWGGVGDRKTQADFMRFDRSYISAR